MGDDFEIVKLFLEKFGWKILDKPHPNDNCCDMTAISNRKSLRIEIKKCRELSNGSWQAQNISQNQLKYDVVAVVLPNNMVFIEDIDHYYKACSQGGYRTFTFLKP